MYDLRIPPGGDPELFTPRPLDGEVESFEVMHSEKKRKKNVLMIISFSFSLSHKS